MKTEYEKKIAMLEAKLSQFTSNNDNIDKLLYTAIDNLSKLDVLYEKGGIAEKRDIIGSMYPEKMTFDGIALRTARVNEAALYMFNIINELEGKKNGTSRNKNNLSRLVPRTGFEPAHPFGRCDLNTVRLPISPSGHGMAKITRMRECAKFFFAFLGM